MNTKELHQEQISALADGELSSAFMDMALVSLRQNESRTTWDVYHQIGDILRSDDMAITLSPDFTSRMFDRLNAEPPMIVAPMPGAPVVEEHIVNAGFAATGTRSLRRFALPGMAAAAAVAAVAFITIPHMMNDNSQSLTPAMLSAVQMTLAPSSNINVGFGTQTVAVALADNEVLRDPRIDEYLSAHQRFSPSLYNTTQYARSATFALDANN
ncbi:sigma-E factor negative regulatory protein [Glaciimonas immobilis]|uniref:Sigma-E factor negative regulatory protein RseA n=1 Tax=Glaciimonas immobilis TaxID=728004 RepID=A0A840RRY9_9BURK|nr:sigma-E factor negative regulatory protein [Glaciimonas immobilis]KAF3997959.1 sigma-E factor negative regulatory protein [Glaciimonas immobilis]MBB5199371.1 sigma-E factor negative regulatory protein RseA [Glaciimonas immobilis]